MHRKPIYTTRIMQNISDRLRQARIDAGFADAADAAASLGIKYPTYAAHENGSRGFGRTKAELYARKFKVSLEWLLTGKGQVSQKYQLVPVVGHVGAGHLVFPAEGNNLGMVEAPPIERGTLAALIVRGDSMFPLCSDGDVVFYEDNISNPNDLIGKKVVCRILNGPTLVKVLRKGNQPGTWNLESINASTIENVILDWVRRVRFIETK
jgi:phage repressor protein C with HTH and peptisase S24 domain